MSMTNITEYIQQRRSHYVKEFTGETLPDELVTKLLHNASWAPSHKLTLPWRFRFYSGAEKHVLCEKMEQYYLEKTPAEKFNQQKLDKIRTYKGKISHIISIGFKPSGLIPEWEELAATAMAVQNIYLTLGDEAHASGYWTTGNGTGSEFMHQTTGLEDGARQLGFFFLGYVEEKRFLAER
jgi:nitroreductase